MSANLPEQLARDADFMISYRAAILGLRYAEESQIDRLISMAFLRGQLVALDQAKQIMARVPTT